MRLFEVPNPASLNSFLCRIHEELRAAVKAKSEYYNFSFEEGKPFESTQNTVSPTSSTSPTEIAAQPTTSEGGEEVKVGRGRFAWERVDSDIEDKKIPSADAVVMAEIATQPKTETNPKEDVTSKNDNGSNSSTTNSPAMNDKKIPPQMSFLSLNKKKKAQRKRLPINLDPKKPEDHKRFKED